MTSKRVLSLNRPTGKPERLRGKGSFVSNDTERLPLWGEDLALAETDWIEIKRVVGFGDQQAMAGKILDSMELPTEAEQMAAFEARMRVKLNAADSEPFDMMIRIVDWNLKDDEGRTVEITYEAILGLDSEVAAEIKRVIREFDLSSGNPTRGRKARNGQGTTS